MKYTLRKSTFGTNGVWLNMQTISHGKWAQILVFFFPLSKVNHVHLCNNYIYTEYFSNVQGAQDSHFHSQFFTLATFPQKSEAASDEMLEAGRTLSLLLSA